MKMGVSECMNFMGVWRYFSKKGIAHEGDSNNLGNQWF